MNHRDTGGRSRTRPALIIMLCAIAAVQFLFAHSFDISYKMAFGGSGVEAALESIAEGSTQRRIGIVALGAIGGLLLIWSRGRRVRLSPIAGTAAAAFVVWSTVSLAWAVDPYLVTRRLVSFWLLVIAAVGVVRWAPPRAIPWFLALSSFLYAVVGVGAELVLGTFAPLASGYRFSGTLHPNAQGVNCAILVLSSIWIWNGGGRRNRFTGLVLGGVGLVLLFLTRSRTSFAATVGASLVLFVLRLHPSRRWVLIAVLANVGILLAMLYVNGLLDAPLGMLLLGRGDEDVGTLNSRLPLWQVLTPYIAQRPLLGFGFSGFMTTQHAAEIAVLLAFGLSAAHSIYLEVQLGLGLVGLGLFAYSLLAAIMRGVVESYGPRLGEGVSLLTAITVFELLNGFLDSSLVFPTWRFPSLLALTALFMIRDDTWQGKSMRRFDSGAGSI